MTSNDLIQTIRNTYEMVISVNNHSFTICDENEKGFSIMEHYKPETKICFKDPESLVYEYIIDNKPLIAYAEDITIEDFTGFEGY